MKFSLKHLKHGWSKVGMSLAVCALAIVPAVAQTTGETGGGEGPDYGALLTSFQGKFGEFMTSIGGPAIGIIVLVGGFWLVIRLVRRGMKSG